MNSIFNKILRNVEKMEQQNREIIQHIIEDFKNSPYLKKSDFIGCYFGEVIQIQTHTEHIEQNIKLLEEIQKSKVENYQLQGICNRILEDLQPLEIFHIWNKENSTINQIAIAGH